MQRQHGCALVRHFKICSACCKGVLLQGAVAAAFAATAAVAVVDAATGLLPLLLPGLVLPTAGNFA